VVVVADMVAMEEEEDIAAVVVAVVVVDSVVEDEMEEATEVEVDMTITVHPPVAVVVVAPEEEDLAEVLAVETGIAADRPRIIAEVTVIRAATVDIPVGVVAPVTATATIKIPPFKLQMIQNTSSSPNSN